MPSYKPYGKIQVVNGVSVAITDADSAETYYVYGTATLTAPWAITMSGTPLEGMHCKFEYRATVTSGGNALTILGTAMPDDYVAKKVNVDCYYNGSDWVVDYQPAFDESDIVTSANIKSLDGAKLNATSVALSKLATTTASRALETSAGGVIQASATTAAELAYSAGITPGTVAVNKVLVPTTGKTLDELNITTPKFNGVAVTATATELNKLSGVTASTAEINTVASVTAGVAAANKVAVLGANKNLDTLVVADGGLYLGSGAGTAITATAAELNKMDGVTATYTELNYVAGVTAGTAAASKAVVLSAASKIDTLDITALKVNGTAVTATGTELNYLSGVTSAVQTQLDALAAAGKTTYSVLSGSQTLTSGTIKANHIVDSSGGATDITLPAAGTLPANTTVEFMRSGANAAAILRPSGTLINIAGSDVASLSMAANGSGMVLRGDGSGSWRVIRWIV